MLPLSRIHSPTLPHCLVEAVREELRGLLDHPGIAVERQRNAEPFLTWCSDMASAGRCSFILP